MNEKWKVVHIRTQGNNADAVAACLAEMGSTGIIVEERELDTFIPPDPDEVPPEYILKAFFSIEEENLQERVENALQSFFAEGNAPPEVVEVTEVQDQDWAEGWKQHFTLFRVGPRLVLKPTWEEYESAPGDAVINLDPGMAFGTGTHATTRLCLEALADLFQRNPSLQKILDVGTGSGILAVAAAALGAGKVLACDIDPEACRTAAENAAANGVSDKVRVTAAPLEELPRGFEVILANILAEENIRLAPELVSRLAAGGHLILSGILIEKEEAVRKGFASFDLSGPDIYRREEWSCLIYRKS